MIHDTEEHVTHMVRFANGSSAVFETAWAANMDGDDFVIFGKLGGLRISKAWGKPGLTFFHEKGGKVVSEKVALKGHPECLQSDFASACLGLKKTGQPNTPGRVGVMIMQVIEGALKSAKEGREVKLSELG